LTEPIIIDRPGVHDIPPARYHEDPVIVPSLSNSIAKTLLNFSPLHAAAEHPRIARRPIRKEKDIFDLGRAAHTLLLGKGEPFEIVKADSWQTKAAREAKKEARAAGKTPILEYQFENTVEMVEACRDQLCEHDEGDLLATGKGEQTIVWKEDDVWCRSLLDWSPSTIDEGCTFVDYKTTGASAHPALWGLRTGPAIGFDFQNAFYHRGIRSVFGVKKFRFVFLVQENRAPYCISIIEVRPTSRQKAMAYVKSAVGIWRACLRDNVWPGYPMETIPVSPEPRITPDPYALEERSYV